MARQRNYRKEYLARTRQQRGHRLPKEILRGHGALPAAVAKRLESGDITKAERAEYTQAIVRYEQQYGPAGSGRVGRVRPVPGGFKSKRQAESWVETHQIPLHYARIVQRGEKWRLTILR
jgi:hypothetical protein